ncbi:hypothetical protein C8F04DRAFT_1178430 [Mycena alexandri]|uniref:Uncharacterized protein n=1 Tax=Mycena alexandri TaxID=1745969 RepID=A0AAD6X5T2_9AGAR|nr:hypothetical protein C8F04DRAFT_1178430 [Mycena alexandri]
MAIKMRLRENARMPTAQTPVQIPVLAGTRVGMRRETKERHCRRISADSKEFVPWGAEDTVGLVALKWKVEHERLDFENTEKNSQVAHQETSPNRTGKQPILAARTERRLQRFGSKIQGYAGTQIWEASNTCCAIGARRHGHEQARKNEKKSVRGTHWTGPNRTGETPKYAICSAAGGHILQGVPVLYKKEMNLRSREGIAHPDPKIGWAKATIRKQYLLLSQCTRGTLELRWNAVKWGGREVYMKIIMFPGDRAAELRFKRLSEVRGECSWLNGGGRKGEGAAGAPVPHPPVWEFGYWIVGKKFGNISKGVRLAEKGSCCCAGHKKEVVYFCKVQTESTQT